MSRMAQGPRDAYFPLCFDSQCFLPASGCDWRRLRPRCLFSFSGSVVLQFKLFRVLFFLASCAATLSAPRSNRTLLQWKDFGKRECCSPETMLQKA